MNCICSCMYVLLAELRSERDMGGVDDDVISAPSNVTAFKRPCLARERKGGARNVHNSSDAESARLCDSSKSVGSESLGVFWVSWRCG
jgi:hypothetical protein